MHLWWSIQIDFISSDDLCVSVCVCDMKWRDGKTTEWWKNLMPNQKDTFFYVYFQDHHFPSWTLARGIRRAKKCFQISGRKVSVCVLTLMLTTQNKMKKCNDQHLADPLGVQAWHKLSIWGAAVVCISTEWRHTAYPSVFSTDIAIHWQKIDTISSPVNHRNVADFQASHFQFLPCLTLFLNATLIIPMLHHHAPVSIWFKHQPPQSSSFPFPLFRIVSISFMRTLCHHPHALPSWPSFSLI